MSLFNFLTKTYGYNKPILANEVEYENYPKQQIYKELSELCKAKKIVRLERGVYFIPKKTKFGIGGAIHHIGNIHKYARPEDVPEHTMFVITTDGQENASRRYTSEQVKKMIERQKEKYGWEFLFIGANIDAVETASVMV